MQGLLLAPGSAQGQQVADPDFDATVANPAFTDKRPTVLFDEAHFNLHTAGGRYKPFVDLMTNDGYAVRPNRNAFTAKTLRGVDILVIVNAIGAKSMRSPQASRPAFTDPECDRVRAWVRRGGSLLLIADHAPMGAAAQILAKRFGIEMSKGHTIDPDNSHQGLGNPGFIIFERDSGGLAEHPITRGRNRSERVRRVMTFVGQSLKGPKGSRAFLQLADSASDIVPPEGKRISARGRAQGIALRLGKGRVIVLGEAGFLSAQLAGPRKQRFGMNDPELDNRQLALNMMHWLSGLLP